MRVLRFLLRMLGWLLTPLVAWAASFSGAMVGAILSRGIDSALTAVAMTLLTGLVFALVAIHAWLVLLRRNPELRAALHLSPEGAPLELEALVEAPVPDEPPGEEPS